MMLGFCFGVCTVAASEAARDAYGESAVDAGEASNSTSSPLLCEPGKQIYFLKTITCTLLTTLPPPQYSGKSALLTLLSSPPPHPAFFFSFFFPNKQVVKMLASSSRLSPTRTTPGACRFADFSTSLASCTALSAFHFLQTHVSYSTRR